MTVALLRKSSRAKNYGSYVPRSVILSNMKLVYDSIEDNVQYFKSIERKPSR